LRAARLGFWRILVSTGRPRIIKKYANRKLYDMEERKYVTIAAVEELVDEGVSVAVIDQETQADITDSVLKRSVSKGTNPRDLVRGQLASLIRSSLTIPMELSQIARDRLQTPETAVSPEEFAELSERVEELAGEVALLRAIAEQD
jgi:polyhydroxyalkanoate synthesis repressor PhaR